MWGFATQAGAGMAIAGLTATYYALAHRNYQGERERLTHEVGHGDGPSVDRQRRTLEESFLPLNSSQMLLKKELEELTALHGSASGLNILYQPSHPLYRFQKSRFEITPIISRVNTSPSTVFSGSEEDLVKAALADESIFGSENNVKYEQSLADAPIVAENEMSSEKNEENLNVDENTANPLEMAKTTSENKDDEDLSELKSNQVEESFAEKWKSVQDNLSLNRTASPICFFKNPGFGNRYAYRIKNEQNQMITQALHPTSGAEGNKMVSKDSKAVQVTPTPSTNDYSDSTQFILSPVLSESNISICDKETPEKYIKKRGRHRKHEKETATPTAQATEKNGADAETSDPLNEISEYNTKLRKRMFQNRNRDRMKGDCKADPLIKLKADPENCNLYTTPVTSPPKKNGKPVILSPAIASSPSTIKVEQEKPEEPIAPCSVKEPNVKIVSRKLFLDESVSNNNIRKPSDNDFAGVLEEPLLLPSRRSDWRVIPSYPTIATSDSSMVTRIPSDSWIALPIRIYTNSMGTMPWSLVGFCVLVVIIAGFLGMILTKLGNRIVLEKQL